jgi:hypothetical protein
MIGEEITLGLLQADGSRRLWHAILDESEVLSGDGGGVGAVSTGVAPVYMLNAQTPRIECLCPQDGVGDGDRNPGGLSL